MADLLLELGTEEVPSRYLRDALAFLRDRAPAVLADTGLAPEEPAVEVFGTPRRLAVVARGLRRALPEETVWENGPPVRVAYDAQGQPTRAAEGFARGKGVEVADLVEREGRVAVRRTVPERRAADVLSEPLAGLLAAIPWAKTMRWGAGSERFVRPVHWLVALVGGDPIPLTFGRVRSGRTTRGHRFAAPDPVQVDGPDAWLTALRTAHVEPDGTIRAERIRKEAVALAAEAGGRLVRDPDNLADNAYLTEWPVACLGRFDEPFLDVPREVLVSAMRTHQRYFAVEDEEGRLLPAFVAVNNTPVTDLDVVTAGHERVLRARLADARFFWDEDRRRPLSDRVDDLTGIIFLARLSAPTVRDKTARLRKLAGTLAEVLGADPALTDRAALLCKADLGTLMVQEFPDLQGVMGRHYALASGEPEAVAEAIRCHYRPRGPDDALPGGPVGAAVALADRLDTLAAGFACGLQPTGSKDAYGLRRAALGVLRILRERGVHLSVRELVAGAAYVLGQDTPVEELAGFVLDRLRHQLVAEGVPGDVADAVGATGEDDPLDAAARCSVLAGLRDLPEMGPLFVGLKRVRNIVRKAGDVELPPVDPERFEMDAERLLYKALCTATLHLRRAIEERDFAAAFQPLIDFKDPIDRFFEDVLVMDPDPDLRQNRLSLCRDVGELFGRLADFSRIRT